ncbi:hypothetical protein M407DRAFT_244472 [Tulasnella calospora MUT 4182]|uniref:Uncharacterized protein n=1 Tax=Tulasnella calospora MUT 4182 TaxID=1051891 RepID=A0A0C3KSH7_9AGAM|nr:hypothetical protein M407DRAFT_244472 [Tulasnella calospora MUT 4182]
MRSRTTTVDSSALSDVSAVAGRDVDLERDPGDAGDQQPNMRAQTNFMPELFVPLVCGIPPVSFVITRRPGSVLNYIQCAIAYRLLSALKSLQ